MRAFASVVEVPEPLGEGLETRCGHGGPGPSSASRSRGFEARPRAASRLNRRRDERGSATIFVIGFALVLFLCAGLVIDGGLAINKRMRVADDAEQVARVGADSIDANVYRHTEVLQIDESLARRRMGDYMASLGYTPGQWEPEIHNDRVSVTVHDTSKSYILGLFIPTPFRVQASAEAVPDTGTGVGGP